MLSKMDRMRRLRIQERQRKGFQKSRIALAQRVRGRMPGNFRIAANLPGRKLSEVFLEFAEPILDQCPTPGSYRNGVTFAVMIWNTAIEPSLRPEMVRCLRASALDSGLDLEGEIDRYMERKRRLFPHDNRLILDYELTGSGKEGGVQVMYMLPQKTI